LSQNKQPSEEFHLKQSKDILQFIYLTLNYDILCLELASHSPSSEFGKDEYGINAYEKYKNRAIHFLENYWELHNRILERDTNPTFISFELEEKIQNILLEGGNKLKNLIKSHVTIKSKKITPS
jgi:hypothetical protein